MIVVFTSVKTGHGRARFFLISRRYSKCLGYPRFFVDSDLEVRPSKYFLTKNKRCSKHSDRIREIVVFDKFCRFLKIFKDGK